MRNEASLPVSRGSPAWKVALHLALLAGLVGVFAWQIYVNWAKIVEYPWQMRWELAALALLLLLTSSWMDILIWNRTLGWFTARLRFRQAAAVYIWSSLARYVPGKVASLLLRVALAAEVDRRAVPVLACSTVELALRTASALLLFLGALLGWGSAPEGPDRRLLLTAALIIPVVLVSTHPNIMLPVLNWGLAKIKRPPMDRSLRYREVLGLFSALLVRWVIYGLAFFTLACAIHPEAAHSSIALVGTAAGSWAFGFIGMTPGGLGLMEWVQKSVLQSTLGFPIAVALVLPVLARLWTLIGEGLWALAAGILWYRDPHRTSSRAAGSQRS